MECEKVVNPLRFHISVTLHKLFQEICFLFLPESRRLSSVVGEYIHQGRIDSYAVCSRVDSVEWITDRRVQTVRCKGKKTLGIFCMVDSNITYYLVAVAGSVAAGVIRQRPGSWALTFGRAKRTEIHRQVSIAPRTRAHPSRHRGRGSDRRRSRTPSRARRRRQQRLRSGT